MKTYIVDEQGIKRDKETGLPWSPSDDMDELLPIDNGSAPWLPQVAPNVSEQISAAKRVDVGVPTGGASATPLNRSEEARDHIAKALELIFPASVWDDSVQETARRVLGYWMEFVPESEPSFKFTTFEAAKSQMILVGDIEFASLCAHHLLPFTGRMHIGYIANDVQVGLSKIPRLVQFWARRPQVQEQLTAQILHDLRHRLGTKDIIVVCEARHTCVSARGARLHNGVMRTALPSGLFMSAASTREEFYSLLARNGV